MKKIPNYEFADSGKIKHRHIFVKPKRHITPNEWITEVIKIENKFMVVKRLYCIYDGCKKYKEIKIRKRICQSCGQFK